jgi:hypothetical protein
MLLLHQHLLVLCWQHVPEYELKLRMHCVVWQSLLQHC